MPFQNVLSKNGTDTECEVPRSVMTPLWAQIGKLRENLNLRIEIPTDDTAKNIGCATGAPCMAAFSQVVIDPNLKIRPCDRLVNVFIGDLNESTVSEVWKSKEAMNILKKEIPICKM
ncbi:hypothetical protein EPN18_04135 [bacterium]|nr:MAG: hypothetical protein EPN18_04135 [bacterium]